MGPLGCESKDSVHFERGLHPSLQNQTSSGARTSHNQRLCKPSQEPLPEGSFAGTDPEKGSREGKGSNLSSFFQQVIHCPQTKSKMVANLGPQCSQQIFERKNIQNGNSRDNSDFPTTRGVSDFAGFQRCLFPHPSSRQVPEISQVPLPKSVLPVPGPSLWPVNSSDGVHLRGQGSQVNGSVPGYKDPPVPRRLVDSSPYQRILPPGHPIPPGPLSGIGLGGESAKIGIGTQTGFRICGLPIRPLTRTGQTDPEPLGIDFPKSAVYHGQPRVSSQELHVTNRPAYSNGNAGAPGETPHKTHSMAPEKTLEGSTISGKGNSSSKVLPPTPMVDQGGKCLTRPAFAPFASCHSNLYRCLKRKLGCSLRRLHSKRHVVSARKSTAYKLPGTKSCLTSLKKIPAPSTRKSSSGYHRQHHGCGIHQQGGRYEVRLTLCPSMATPVRVQSETGCPEGQAHPWSSKCDCRQVVSARPNHSDRMVPSSGGVRPPGSELAPSGHVCNKVQLQTSPICVSSAGPQCLGIGRPDSLLGEPGHVCLSPSVVTGQGGQQTIGPSLQESDPNSPGLAQHAMVLGSGGTVVLDSSLPPHSSRPTDTAIQQGMACHRDLTNLNLHAWLLEPRQSRSRVSLVQWRRKLRLLKEVQPEQSMRQNGPFLSDGVKQVRWTSGLHLSIK